MGRLMIYLPVVEVKIRLRQKPSEPLPNPTQPANGPGFGSNSSNHRGVMFQMDNPQEPLGTKWATNNTNQKPSGSIIYVVLTFNSLYCFCMVEL